MQIEGGMQTDAAGFRQTLRQILLPASCCTHFSLILMKKNPQKTRRRRKAGDIRRVFLPRCHYSCYSCMWRQTLCSVSAADSFKPQTVSDPLIAAPYIQYQTLHSLLYSGQNIEMSGRSDDCQPVTLSSLSWVSVQETKENSLFVKVRLCSVSGCLWFWCFPAGTLEEEETGKEVSWASLALFLLRMNMNSAQLRFLTVPSDSVQLQTGFRKKGTEEEDFTLMHRITRRDEVVQTLVIKLPFVKCSCGMSSTRQVAEIWIQP